MNTLKALQSKIGLNYPGIEDAATVALIDQGLTGQETYSADYLEKVEIAQAGLILTLLTSVKSVTEGGYSISLADRESLTNVYTLIVGKYGLPDLLNPSITDSSYLW